MQSPLKVLVVEDDAVTRRLIAAVLKKIPRLEVLEGANFKEGTRLFASHHPRIVLTDIVLPDGSGVNLLEEIKATDPGVQVIVITGDSTLERALQCLERGALEYLSKPLHLPTVHSIVSHAVDRYWRWYDIFSKNMREARENEPL